MTPRVGDKVVFTGNSHNSATWQQRQERPGIVVAAAEVGGHLTVWSPHEFDCYYAPARSLRVVEVATYSPTDAAAGSAPTPGPAADTTPDGTS